MEKENDAEFFVKLEDPSQFRRALLESSRDVVRTLERYEGMKAMRIQKVKYASELKNVVKDIQLLLGKLKNSMPRAKVREKMSKKVPFKPVRAAQKKKSAEIDSLEEELKHIQEKLDILG